MDKPIKQPKQNQESKKTFPLDEVNKTKQQKNQAAGVGETPKDDVQKGHTRAP